MAETSNAADKDAVALIREQHEQIRTMFGALGDAVDESSRETYECLVRLLAVHETAEEVAIYPALESEGEEGRRIAAERRAEEDEGKRVLADLEKFEFGSDGFDAQLVVARTKILAHAEQEEATVLPLLEQSKDADQRRRLSSAMQLVESIAPTHPHPHSPEGAVGNLAVGPVVGLFDRARDLVRDALR